MQGQKRLTGNTPMLMVFFAATVDLVQIFLDFILIGLVLNRLIDIFVVVLFYAWFRSKGVDFKKTRALIFFGLAAAEFILPGVDAFPLWILDIVLVITSVKMEDRLGISTAAALNNPRFRNVMAKGVNAVGNRSATARNALNKVGWRGGQQQKNATPSEDSTKRNVANTPSPNTTRDAKIKEQQNRKSNSSNGEQN